MIIYNMSEKNKLMNEIVDIEREIMCAGLRLQIVYANLAMFHYNNGEKEEIDIIKEDVMSLRKITDQFQFGNYRKTRQDVNSE